MEREPVVVAVTGLLKEARIAAGRGVRAIAAGAQPGRLAGALEHEIALGAKAVISFGVAGGLVEHLISGDWLVAKAIVTPNERWPCDRAWSGALAERLSAASVVELAGADALVIDRDAKLQLHHATGAAAVDTESHIAAAIAATHKLPFAAFRVVLDGARRSLPSVACVGVAPDGTINGAAVLRSLARAPGQLPLLLRTAIDARTAFRALLRGRRLLGPGLAYPDFTELLLDVS
ncbi:MAG: phosphorylase [Betaproteobacteria bacterium]|nr:MAG: phosphorylase [Betaproteobacteria bacterium]